MPFALVGGIGHAYGVLGFHVEYRRGHWAGFLGLGFPGTLAPVAGVKWFSGDGHGLVLSLHADVVTGLHPVHEFDLVMWASASMTVGFRGALAGRYFVEAGAGLSYYIYRMKVEDFEDERRLVIHTDKGWGALGPRSVGPVIPDFACAIGLVF